VEYTRKRLLTPPLFKLAEGITRVVKFTGEMYTGKPQKPKEGEKAKEPAILAPCVNLEDGETGVIIISAVVKSVLSEEYPANKYVGLCFAITKLGRAAGKSYNTYKVEEIDEPGNVAQHPAAALRPGGSRRA